LLQTAKAVLLKDIDQLQKGIILLRREITLMQREILPSQNGKLFLQLQKIKIKK